ncbi:glycoside hydrolase family 13 protein [Brachybacterium sp. ACRRE]|uniref:glycoside hydrolase family 13 protein n=1 Tax=Brachybacterium sp. ACRRE TaxID=2918184 RepID=UPI001EF2FCAA|nr:glycoside hydrolase family 13 protein [Brachybacterium sp. ACRRE]MCG7308790.1 glycoside hydrolase family 13 protein [Brachybacterium sp. ACRRE]
MHAPDDPAPAVRATGGTCTEPSGLALPLQPHHDSGPLHVQGPDGPGEEALLRVWVPASYPVRTIALRAVRDGEILTSPLAPEDPESPGRSADGGAATGTWWSVRLRATNPITPYRFCVLADSGARSVDGREVPEYAWLTAAGLFPWDVSDATDFRLVTHEHAPTWVDDAIVYQVFPDRFARSTTTPVDEDGRPAPSELPDWAVPMHWDDEPAVSGDLTGRQMFGGDLDGIIERLDHIASLGADTVYLTPVFPAGSVHRYDASTFDRVDPLLGGDEALARLSEALHARGMRLVLDLTTNHTGATHEWFRAAQADARSSEAGFYLFEEHPDSYTSWMDVPSLPKLDLRDSRLRERLTRGPGSVVGRWLRAPFLADGWRIDVANMTGRHGSVDVTHEVAREIRATLRGAEQETGRETWLVAEHGHDASGDLAGDGWHGTMNYAGFTRPLWAWLAEPGSDLNWLGLPMTLPRLGGGPVSRTLRDYNAQLPWPSRVHSQNQLSSHDTPRTRTVVGERGRQLTAVAALATLPGVPTVFAGDELGATGLTGEHSRTPMPWEAIAAADPERVDLEVLEATRILLGLRREQVSLRRGGLRWLHAGDDALVIARTHPLGDTVVHLARGPHAPVALDLACLPAAGPAELLPRVGGAAASTHGSTVTFTADSAGASLLSLPRGTA